MNLRARLIDALSQAICAHLPEWPLLELSLRFPAWTSRWGQQADSARTGLVTLLNHQRKGLVCVG